MNFRTTHRSALLALMLAAAPSANAEPWLCTQPDGSRRFSYEPESARNPRCVDHPIRSGNVVRVPRKDETRLERPHLDADTPKDRDRAASGWE